MKTMRWLSVVLVLALVLAFAGSALANGGIEGVNSFTITPDSIRVGYSGTVYINANLTSADGTTYFCLYISDTLADPIVSIPNSIVLKYKSGFSFVDATFVKTAQGGGEPTCPVYAALTGYLYKGTGLPTGDKTYSGSFTLTMPNDPSYKGNYKLVFFPEEPTPGGMEFAEAPFSILGPSAVSLKGTTAHAALPLGLVLVTAVLGVSVLVLRRRA